jgi:cell division septal protein FtsQ
VQRPAARRTTGPAANRPARQKGFAWNSALAYLPLALKVLLAVSLGMLAFVGYRTAASASFFKVRTVDVEGAARVPRDDIRAAVLRASNSGVWKTNLEAVTREVRALPWVRDVVVSRVLPSGLRVRITEREPRVIARTASGRLVWVDDDGVMLGAASPGEHDFFIRGIDESRADEALRQNRERVRAALELAGDWERAGLSSRVSEVNLDDLHDVRVQLAGDDAEVEVRLGREDFAKRFRQSLEVLDAQRHTPRGPFVTYIDVSQGKRAIIGTGTNAHFQLSDGGDAEAGEPSSDAAAHAPSRMHAPVASAKKGETKRDEKTKNARQGKEAVKGNAARRTEVAVRPRRVG